MPGLNRALRIPQNPHMAGNAARALHLEPQTAAVYLQSHIPGSTIRPASAFASPPSTLTHFRLSPSRSHNAPILQALRSTPSGLNPTGPPLVLDIRSNALPESTGEWLWRQGRETRLRRALEGAWGAWREGRMSRLEMGLGLGGGSGGGDVVLSDVHAQIDDFSLSLLPPALASAATPENDPTLHPLERKARASGLFYHKRPLPEGQGTRKGGIGTYGYGAGNAMATMDALIREGGEPTNFLDGGGGATESNVQAALELLFADPDVRVIFINSFGGLTKTELIAQGLITFLRDRKAKGETWPPIVVRLRGTGEKEAAELLSSVTDLAGIVVQPELRAAAQAAVSAWKSLDA